MIVTGPPGSGKTTVARLLAAERGHGVHLESDRFFQFIISGYVEPWRTEAHQQNTAVMTVVGAAATGYACAGYFTVIDGIISPRWFLQPLRRSLSTAVAETAYVILRPPLNVAVARARSRERTRLSDPDVIAQLWHDFADHDDALERHVIDNGSQTAAETVDAINERLRRGTLSV